MSNTSLEKSKIRILLLEGVHQSAIDTLNAAGYTNIEYLTHSLGEEELIEKIADAHFVGIRSRTQLTEKVFEAARKLVAVGCFCIGTNQVDLQAATRRGVAVFNAPFSNTRSVAELVLAQAILLLRGVPEKNAKAHRGEWLKSAKNSYEIRGKKLGIIGYGNIGTQFSVLAESLGMDVYFYDVVSKLPIGNATQVGTLQELLNISDVVSLHVPETPATKYMFKAEQFAQMKPGSILMNASRGTVVDIDALADALSSGKLLGAAIDVFPVEPKSNDEEFVSPLREFDNCILTPHVGGSTIEAQENIGREVAEKLAMYSDNGTSVSSVNFPEVALPSHPNQHRLLHIHENVPGVMSEINQVFSENGINVCGQYLQTKEDIGYVVVDVDKAYGELALEKLRQVKGTIRCRVLF
ncbi:MULTISPECIES: phosphoglycerate dehydrogenase [Marinobacter]|jgi:D-3-phosphoglycerate dehydrogenase|uniref:D-3-phosphoglycerate dehydrogenase n=2 Tax=Marinobacter nauticus TaxID=2743 RepID=A0A368XSD2_MARNT|nr:MULTISPECIES: phosphoglycerate dehydrogenase [Marinobacter]MEC7432921.1 phosphoglycerate dehydrogenase [Pseudomonadota bacterium]ABM19894.1 D-3-phosphoglycerate dehydrogenase [Marinobacter nauticus VT8]KAE8545190.1 D-3-phosphoglycerate dehydrogenase [Marinobacter nauticus]MAC21073.1 D-3-phosphoglycerate dehydrogenase [Marinobacter sp.]MAH32064.1 D-3-phosphoglycerate dehydrogenase [Marinobacter sp.]|tara:strand:+ start:31 stop:1260 length:1230 start_codon:yes stop_codon:yes gene_type:complete